MHRVPRVSLIAAAALAACAGAHAAPYTWSSGSFVAGVTAPNPLALGDTLDIVAGGNKFLDAVALTNNGVVNWSADPVYLQNGGSVNNQGTWNATGDNSLLFNGGATTAFQNAGVFRKSGGLGDTSVANGVGFVNTGTIDAQTGRIVFQGGSRFEAGSVFTGAGTVAMVGGSNTFSGAYTSGNLLLQGGSFVGQSAVAQGSTRWTGGYLMGGWTVASGATLHGQAGGNKFIDSGTLTNQGTLAWETTDAMYLQGGAVLANQGTLDFSRSAQIAFNGGAATAIQNAAGGTIRARDGATLTVGNGTGLVNSGTLQAAAGSQIRYAGGSTFAAGTVFDGAGSNVAAGPNTFSGSFTSGNLVLESGQHIGAGAVALGSTRFSGGNLTGSWTLAGGATLHGVDGGNKFIDAGNLLNQGTLAWDSGNALYLQNGATLTNEGLVVANAGTSFHFNGGAATTLANTAAGTLRAAAGQTLTLAGGLGLVNTGTLDAQAGGAIVLGGGAQLNDGSRFTGTGSVFADGSNTFAGTLESGNLLLRGGNHIGSGALVHGTLGFSGGVLTGSWTVGNGHTLAAGDGSNKFVDNGTLTNAGTVAWNSGNALYLQNAGTVQNQGLWLANASTTVAFNGGAQTGFVNGGTVRAVAGSTLTLGNGLGFVSQGGTLDAQGSIVVGGGARFEAGSRFSGPGTVYADNTNTFRGSYDSTNLVLRGGTHVGDDALAQGRTVFSGGVLAGRWTVGAGATLAASDGSNKYIDNGTLVNQGRLAWGSTNGLFLQNGGVLRNEGVADLGADGGWFFNGGSAVGIVNTGLVVKSAGGGSFTIGNGTNFVNQGTLDVASGTIALPNNFVNDGTLKGTGTFSLAGTLTNHGHLAPGASPGTLTLNGHYLQSAQGSFDAEIGTLAASDLFNVNGNATLGGTLALSCFGACSLAVGDQLVILDATGSLSGSFASVTLSGFGSGAFEVVYDATGSRVLLQVTQAVSAVPEPGTWAMWLAGIAAMGTLARRRSLVA